MAKKNDAPKIEPTDELAEGVNLLEGVTPLATAPILAERAQVVVPKKGKLFEERVIQGGHTVKVAKYAVIRPCQSKGKSIRGFQPIYEPRMLAENASVFTGWQMFMDHVAEEIAEAIAEFLQEKGRSSKDLGGRLLKTWYDPELSLESDEENGFRKGGVVGELIPYKIVREYLEEDPFSLAVSINAWPTAARIGRASWDTTKKGAVIEGIRSKPQGSVDFVPRAGAGGRFLTEHASPEEVRSAVSLLESAYSASRDDDHDPEEPAVKKKLSEMNSDEIAKLTPEQLHEALALDNPSLAEKLQENGGSTPPIAEADAPITKADLDRALTDQRTALTEEFADARESVEERAEEMLNERDGQRILAGHAEKLIQEAQSNGLPGEFANQIRQNYMLTEGGARPGIIVTEAQLEGPEGETFTAKQVVEARIKGDLETSVKLIEAAGGTPRIKGLSPDGKAEQQNGGGEGGGNAKPRLREGSAWTDFLRESGDLTGDNDKDIPRVREMVEG